MLFEIILKSFIECSCNSSLPSATVVVERLCFYRCLSILWGERCTPPRADTHPHPHPNLPPRQAGRHPTRQTPPRQAHPPKQTPPSEQTPPSQGRLPPSPRWPLQLTVHILLECILVQSYYEHSLLTDP